MKIKFGLKGNKRVLVKQAIEIKLKNLFYRC